MTTSAYPVIWALKHAPVADAYERGVLLALADSGDPDGCDCYSSPETMTVIAKCDAQTVKDRCKAMQKRGLIRRQRQAPNKPGWLRIPRNRRPAVWELMIPYSWWSDEQRAEINRMRAERGANTEPITPETRPSLTPAPQRAPRADKGRTRADVQPDEDPQSPWGVSQTPQGEPVENRPGGSTRPRLGGLQDPAWGVYKTPNPPGGPSCVDPPEETSVRTSYSLRSPEHARADNDPIPTAPAGPETEIDTQPETPGAAPTAEPDTDYGDENDTAAGQARRLAAVVDWTAEVGAWDSQLDEIHAAIAAASNRGVDPGVLGAYLPALANRARTVRYVLTGLSPDRLPTGATLASLGLATAGATNTTPGRALACPTHPDAFLRTHHDGTRACPHCDPPAQQPLNTPTYVHDLLTTLRADKGWHHPTTDRQAAAGGAHSGPQPALARSPGERQPDESQASYIARIGEQLWQLDRDTHGGAPKAAA